MSWTSHPSLQVSKSVFSAKGTWETPGHNVLWPKGTTGPLLPPFPRGMFYSLMKNGLNLKQKKFHPIFTVYFRNLKKSTQRYSWKNRGPEIAKMLREKEEGSLALWYDLFKNMLIKTV